MKQYKVGDKLICTSKLYSYTSYGSCCTVIEIHADYLLLSTGNDKHPEIRWYHLRYPGNFDIVRHDTIYNNCCIFTEDLDSDAFAGRAERYKEVQILLFKKGYEWWHGCTLTELEGKYPDGWRSVLFLRNGKITCGSKKYANNLIEEGEIVKIDPRELIEVKEKQVKKTYIDVTRYANTYGLTLKQAHEEIQPMLFECGYNWAYPPYDREVSLTYAEYLELNMDKELAITQCSSETFAESDYDIEWVLKRNIEFVYEYRNIIHETEYVEINGKRYDKSKLEKALAMLEEADETIF